jgi:hypothetical protein
VETGRQRATRVGEEAAASSSTKGLAAWAPGWGGREREEMGRMAAGFLTAWLDSLDLEAHRRRRQPPRLARSGIVGQARQRKTCACTLHLSRAAAGFSIGTACADDEPPGLAATLPAPGWLVFGGRCCAVRPDLSKTVLSRDRGPVGVDARGDRSEPGWTTRESQRRWPETISN